MKSNTVIDNIYTSVEIDHETGEITKEETQTSFRVTHAPEPPFIKLYIEDVLYIADMPKSLANTVYAFLQYTTFANAKNGMCVVLNPYIKEQICQDCGFDNVRSLNNALGKLVKGDILRRLGAGTYQFNPYLFGRGEWRDIDNIRATWTYDLKGRTFNSVINYKTEKNGQLVMEFENGQERETDTDTLQPISKAI